MRVRMTPIRERVGEVGLKLENDVYQSVCSFLNRFGGDIYLGEYSYAEEPTMSDRWLNQSKIIHFLQISS